MKKNDIRMAVASAVLVILAHLLVFLLPFHHGVIFWFSYVFLLIAFGVAAAAFALAFRGQQSMTSRFYGIPIAKVGVLYLAVQAVLSLVFMALGQVVPFGLVLVADAVLLGAAMLGLVAQDIARDHIQALDARLDTAVSVIRSAQSTLNLLVSRCDNLECRAAVQKLADELRYSDPVSSSELAQIEADLCAAIDELQQAVVDGDDDSVLTLCTQTRTLLDERNRLCKLGKKSR